MKEDNFFHIKDAFAGLIREYDLESIVVEQKIKEIWAQTVGDFTNNATVKITYANQRLTVFMNSSIIRQELFYAKNEILKKINENLKDYKIIEIYFK